MSTHEVENALSQEPMTARELVFVTGLSRGFVNKTLLSMIKSQAAHVSHIQRVPGASGRPSPVYQAGFSCSGGVKTLAHVMQSWRSA
jgi:hypothetical protein